nr:GtrA family protein [Lachnospiraceae bacterium]
KDSIKIYKEIFKYAGSSMASFMVDYLMYVILTSLFGAVGTGLIIANYGARAISSVFNFTLNKKYVFESKGKLLPELIKYYALAFANISINTLILTTLTGLGLNSYGAKIIVEVIMFVVCYIIQHYLIFNTSKELVSRKEQLWTRILKNLKNKSVQ